MFRRNAGIRRALEALGAGRVVAGEAVDALAGLVVHRKLGDSVALTADIALTEPAEIALAMKLAQFAEATHDVLADHRPNTLATYLYELANAYHSFYEACHVLNSEGTVRNTRLLLCDATSKVLKQGLSLLGIRTTERM